MRPICRDYHNTKFVAEGCGDLTALKEEAYMDGWDCITSTWRPSWRERLHILFGIPVILGIMGTQQPPVHVMSEKQWLAERKQANKETD